MMYTRVFVSVCVNIKFPVVFVKLFCAKESLTEFVKLQVPTRREGGGL